MRKLLFAMLAVVGFALTASALAPVGNAAGVNLHPPNENEGANN